MIQIIAMKVLIKGLTGCGICAMAKMYRNIGEEMWKRTDKVGWELFVLTYGSVVAELVRGHGGNMDAVNRDLDMLGHNMGIRLADDFFAKTMVLKCWGFQDTVDMICLVGFKMYMGIVPRVVSIDDREAVLEFDENNRNILTEFVDLDETTSGLVYSQIYCGIIRGALSAVGIDVECRIENERTGPTAVRIRQIRAMAGNK